jgi:asparagine synthase (glutamine-hydrolysing)
MCGLAGILAFSGASPSREQVRRMGDSLAHRGADDSGEWVGPPMALAHRRLSIIDLTSAAHQPMVTDDGRFVLVYNGEVYNFRELRADLERDGIVFVSRSDTEVVLKAFQHWGSDCVARFNGMFAFAVWDSLRQELTLARDRYGMKPLYWARTSSRILFASEAKAILASGELRASLDPRALQEYLNFQNLFTDRTLFKSICLLPPATIMTISANGSVTERRYWDWQFRESDHGGADAQELEDELHRLLSQAVNRQLVSDVDVGAYLSGGIDSGSIGVLAARQLPFMRSFTVGFDVRSASGLESSVDERPTAEHMSYLFGTEHYEMVLKAGDMERAMPKLTWHLEEPRVGQSYPNFYASLLASRFGKVVLSGAGGDEIFGGYPWRYYRAVVNDDFDHYVSKYFNHWQRLASEEELTGLLHPIADQVSRHEPLQIFKNVFENHAAELTRPEDYINHSLYFEAKTFLHGLLVVEDKLSMAHGLEVRLPFLDNDLVDFATSLPVDQKLGNVGEVVGLNENEVGAKTERYFQKTRDGKLILRRAMARDMPSSVAHGEKRGFSAPDASWFRGESIDYVRRRLMDGDSPIYEFVDRKCARKLIDDHVQGRSNRRLLVWSLLSLDQWCRTFIDDSAPEVAA